MKGKTVVCGLLLAACGCDSMNNTEKGMVGGGLIGTGFGAVIGSLFHHAGLGAAAGAIAGTAAGGLAGSAQDHREDRQKAQALETARVIASQQPNVTVQDVVKMTLEHQPTDIIMRQIETTNSTYNLTVEDISYMTQYGVSSQVIGFMQGRRRIAVAPVVQPAVQRVYIYEPPPPPVSFGVGVGYGGYRRW
jgi:outer membrane lipoprotein SlyB